MTFRFMTAVVCLCALARGAEFETASVKPAPPSDGPGIAWSMSGGPGSNDPGRFTCRNCDLTSLVSTAFDLRPYQLTAPPWMGSVRFDVVAKIAEGATREQFREMLQKLLTDRFQMATHRDSKEVSAYELVVAKGGAKLTEATVSSGSATSSPGMNPGGGGGGVSSGMVAGALGNARSSGTSSMAGSMTMARLSEGLARQLGRPVTDATGLTGKYEIKLQWSKDSADDQGVSIFAALQQLGLKLEAKKGPIEVLVVDHMERTATEN